MKTGSKPYVDVIRLRIRLLWLLVAAMIAYVAVVVLFGGGDSRVMNDSAETMYRVIYFGGLVYVGWRIYANKKLLKDRLLRKEQLQKEMGLTYLFISHDLSVVKFISDKILVMYLGAMVEFGSKHDIFANPLHPYTKALFSAIPNPDPDAKMHRIVLGGDIPSPANPPKGCRFHTRCPYATEICKHVTPAYTEHEPGHFAACHLLNKETEHG